MVLNDSIQLHRTTAVAQCRARVQYTLAIAILLTERMISTSDRLTWRIEILTPQSAIEKYDYRMLLSTFMSVGLCCTHVTLGCTSDVPLMAMKRYDPGPTMTVSVLYDD